MDYSMPGFPVHHQYLELAQTHVHWVGDAIQPSPHAFNLSQHQGLFKWIGSSHKVAKALELQLHHQSFQWIFRVHFFFGLTGLISLKSNRFSRVFSSTTIQKDEFFMVQLSHEYMTAGNTIALTIQTFVSKEMSLIFNTLSRFVITFDWLWEKKRMWNYSGERINLTGRR